VKYFHAFPDALAGYLRARGGEVRTGVSVKRILVESGRAVGVRLADGSELHASRLVVSNTKPARVALDFLSEDEIGADVAGRMRRVRWGLAQMTIWLALEGPVETSAFPLGDRSLYVHASGTSLDSLLALTDGAHQGMLPAEPALVLVNEGGVDPSRAPAGRSSLEVLVMALPREIRGDASGAVSARSWAEAAGPYADHVLAWVERDFMPGLRSRILARTGHDPVTMSVESPDAIQGDIGHGALVPEQAGGMGPIPELGRHRTPVTSLYVCGSGSHPGSGVSLAPGRNAATAICADLGLAR